MKKILFLLTILLVTEQFVKPMVVKPIKTAYYLMNTCNKWTAKGLKSAGLNLSPTFKLTAESIMNYLESNENVVTSPST